jgi:hypothetical protein
MNRPADFSAAAVARVMVSAPYLEAATATIQLHRLRAMLTS